MVVLGLIYRIYWRFKALLHNSSTVFKFSSNGLKVVVSRQLEPEPNITLG